MKKSLLWGLGLALLVPSVALAGPKFSSSSSKSTNFGWHWPSAAGSVQLIAEGLGTTVVAAAGGREKP